MQEGDAIIIMTVCKLKSNYRLKRYLFISLGKVRHHKGCVKASQEMQLLEIAATTTESMEITTTAQ